MNSEINKIEPRYIGHVEDDPMIWQKSSDDIEDIITRTETMVSRRNIENCAGEGVVIDTVTKNIVSCFGMDMPNDEIEKAHVIEVVMRWADS